MIGDDGIRGFRWNRGATFKELVFEEGSRLKVIQGELEFSELKSVSIPACVERIKRRCFAQCVSLLEVIFEPESRLQKLSSETFRCTGIQIILIPKSVEVIGKSCFYCCGSLHEVFFEEGSRLREIKEDALVGTQVKELTIPRNCRVLSTLSVKGVKRVRIDKRNPFLTISEWFIMDCEGKHLFGYLGTDSSVFIRKEIEVIEKNCFSGCRFLHEVTFEFGSQLKRIEERAFAETGLTGILIPRNVEVIGGECFCFCEHLKSVIFEQGSCLKELKESVFRKTAVSEIEIPAKCEVLTGRSLLDVRTIRVHEENPFLVAENGFVMSHDGKQLVRYIGSETRIVIKKEVEVIGDGCFQECETVLEVCFEPESRLRCIDAYAFWETDLTEITIPASVKVIGEGCFANCYFLCDVAFEGEFPESGKRAFWNCPVEKASCLWSKGAKVGGEQE
jgi:hypothetical protein